MGLNDRKKERHRRKRQEKRAAQRRASAASPFQRIGSTGEIEACYVNANWRDTGQASIFLLRRHPAGGYAMAAYLVDLWCTGLKDAFGDLGMTRQEFESRFLQRAEDRMEIVRLEPSTAKALVAGGIRFARQNGFRLPRHYERWTALLGDIGDWPQADLSQFGKDGKLLFVGSMLDLRKRLIGSSVEQFLQREDVQFTVGEPLSDFGGDDFGDEDEEFDPDEEAFDPQDEQIVEEARAMMRERIANRVRQWCFAKGIAPSPRLADAAEVLLVSSAASAPTLEEDHESQQAQMATESIDKLEERLATLSPAEAEQIRQGMNQLGEYTQRFSSPAEFWRAVGLGDEPGGDDDGEIKFPWET